MGLCAPGIGEAAVTSWIYIPRESLALHLRRRRPIGRRPVFDAEVATTLSRLAQSQLSTDILLTIASQELGWMTDGRVTCDRWSAIELSNEGAYLFPRLAGPIRVHRKDRQFDETLSSDGAGLCATFFLIQNLRRREDPWVQDRRRWPLRSASRR